MAQRKIWLVIWFACAGCQMSPMKYVARGNQSFGEPNEQFSVADGAPEQDQRAIETHADALPARLQRAESYLRQQRYEEAQQEFERLIADTQDRGKGASRLLIHSHRRLLELALRCDDEYAQHLHRGVALYWLAAEREQLTDADGPAPRKGVLFKAVSELVNAHLLRPEEARPCWYLHLVWSDLGQRHPARRWLDQACAAAPFTFLTPHEQGKLHLASSIAQPPRSFRA